MSQKREIFWHKYTCLIKPLSPILNRMTSELRHLIQMIDIRGVEIAFQNPKCATKGVISSSVFATQEVPGSCPLCKQPLFDPEKGTWEYGRMLRDAIAALARAKVTNVYLEVVRTEVRESA